jgi:flagellar assembly protein FliH
MLSLVITIARQLIHAELSVNSAIILGTIERALQAAVRSDAYHLRVNEEDLAVVTEKKPLFLARISSLKNLTIEADPTVGRGGCRLESDLGEVDATMESQIEVIRRTLSGAVAGTP